jgi:hypothetical protein
MRRSLTLLLGLLLAGPCLVSAQGLGDAAARERQKRAAQEGSGKAAPKKVLTDADLAEGRPPADASKPSSGSSASASSESHTSVEASPSTVVDSDASLRPYVDAVTKAQARVEEQEARIRMLGAKLNPMSTSFIYGATGSNSANEEAQVRAAMGQAEAELSAARKALSAANEALQDSRRGRSSTVPTPQ